jgi:hypothetical protein
MRMRIRQVKPEFWTDSLLATLSDRTRLTYLGLWMLADDRGWLRFRIDEMAAAIFPYKPRAARERSLHADATSLMLAGRIVLHDCGHAEIPTLTRHQRFAGSTKRVQTVYEEHMNGRCPRVPAGSRGFLPPDGNVEDRNVIREEREGWEPPPAGLSEFQRKVPRPPR